MKILLSYLLFAAVAFIFFLYCENDPGEALGLTLGLCVVIPLLLIVMGYLLCGILGTFGTAAKDVTDHAVKNAPKVVRGASRAWKTAKDEWKRGQSS